MRWIGQHIWDFISRFRSDVYLEDLNESTQDHVVGIDADGKLYKQDVSVGDITGVTAGTNCSGGGSSGNVTINVDDAFLINSGDDVTIGTITANGFKAGSTVVEDDIITMTPSTNDTVTFRAETNGELSIITTDLAAAAANITIQADGTAEVAGTTVTLDSAANIELEVGAATNYISTTGIYRGSNIGVVQDGYIPLMPIDFMVASSYRNYGNMDVIASGKQMSPSSASAFYFCQKIIPKGYTASTFRVNGVDGGSNASVFTAYENTIAGASAVTVTANFAFNTDQAVLTGRDIIGDGEKFATIVFDPGDTSDVIHGGKIYLTKTT